MADRLTTNSRWKDGAEERGGLSHHRVPDEVQRLSLNKSIDAKTDGDYEGNPYKGVEIHFNLAFHGCCERRQNVSGS